MSGPNKLLDGASSNDKGEALMEPRFNGVRIGELDTTYAVKTDAMCAGGNTM